MKCDGMKTKTKSAWLYVIAVMGLGILYLVPSSFAAAPAPTVSILNPKPGTAASPTAISLAPGTNDFRVQVQVWNDVADITAVSVGYYSGASPDHLTNFTWVAASVNANYSCGTNCAVYEARLSLAAGNYYLAARAQSTADGMGYSADQRTGNDAQYISVAVKSAKTGTGTLLVRDSSNQLCMDCHNVSSHSSQSTDTSYGNWQTGCLECHTPHSTNNIFLIRQSVVAPDGVWRTVNYFNTTGDANNSYVNSAAGANTRGLCQVCHTRTQGPGSVVRWRYSGNADSHYTAAAGTQPCRNCHSHSSGFKGPGCDGCHDYDTRGNLAWGTGFIAQNGLVANQTAWGAHAKHINHLKARWGSILNPVSDLFGGGAFNAVCGVCHTGAISNHMNTTRQVNFRDGAWGSSNQFGVSLPLWNAVARTCSNLDCHYKATPQW